MRKVLSGLGLVAMVAGLLACSSDRPERQSRPRAEGQCRVAPDRLGEAEKIPDFGSESGCGVRNAWRVYSLHNVRFSQPLVMNCATANTFAEWIQTSVQPAADDRFGERVVKLTTPAGYACRRRNNSASGKLSEHARGNAVDVSGFTFADGTHVTVEQGWFASRRAKKFLQTVRQEACGLFKTVLGPGSDRYHDDHLHLDLQRHRSGGAYCR